MPPKLTQPLRPAARYRKGQGPAAVESDSDSNSDSERPDADDSERANNDDPDNHGDEAVHDFVSASTTRRAEPSRDRKIGVNLRNVNVDPTGTRAKSNAASGSESEYETDSEAEQPTSAPNKSAASAVPAEEESSEYETDSEEEEEPLKPIYKPVFVSKRNRDTIAARDKELDPEVVEAKRAAEIELQREQSKNLVADSIVRELATKETEAVQPDVDDTDGLDPEAEFEEWKLRELTRLKRDKEARYALEKIKEEVEARRSMPEALRLKEDTERAEKTRKDKKKGSQVFMQKYHHKGAFHQDLDILKKHDYTAPTISTVDVSSLPEVLQRRNFGKASQSKYTHLADQDTSRKDGGFGGGSSSRLGGSGGHSTGCFNCGGPHLKRDCPNLNDPALAGPSGSNSSAMPSTSNSRDGGWGPRPSTSTSDRDREDRFAPPGSDSRAGKRGGIGFDRRGGAGGGRRDQDDDYRRASERRRSRSRSRERARSRSRSPPRSSTRTGRGRSDYDSRDERRDAHYEPRDRDRERDSHGYDRRDRRRSRSRSVERRKDRDNREDRDKRRRVD
ncbi:uncharacterized protein JCM15063_001644 [Sporobolomyces koalae]|uniref:uncharacterized protein n=1 Tax=Sporobolomyces koalae TaxID=500713 RepID=UPI0031762BC8